MKTPALLSLEGKTALIAGGGGKMGRQFTKTLVDGGARVVVADLPAAIRDLKKQMPHGRAAEYVACDMAKESNVKALFAAIGRRTKKLDVIVSAMMAKPAGYYRPFEKYPLKTWQGVLDGNLTGAFLLCRYGAEFLKKDSSVIFIASIYGCVAPDQRIYDSSRNVKNLYGGADPLNLPAAYSASKAGLIGLAKHMAALWGPRGVRVNVLTPGGVEDGQPNGFRKAYKSRTPLGRMAEWTDYNGALQFLASDASRYMTGANLIVDGGWTTW